MYFSNLIFAYAVFVLLSVAVAWLPYEKQKKNDMDYVIGRNTSR